MHNASTLAGMAFANAFLGINHSLAHKWGGRYHTAHGRTNAILMPHVIRYNAKKPAKFAAWPKYTHFVADERYAEIARILGLPARTTEEGVNSLIGAIRELNSKLGIEESFQRQHRPKDFEKMLSIWRTGLLKTSVQRAIEAAAGNGARRSLPQRILRPVLDKIESKR